MIDIDSLLGKRYVTDLRVLAVGESPSGRQDDPERTVRLIVNGDRAEISLGELRTLIESGMVCEAGEVFTSGFRRRH